MTATRFDTVTTNRGLGYNAPQKMGRRLWLPMFLLALMAFPVAWTLGAVLSGRIASFTGEAGDLESIWTLRHLVPAFGFIGFIGVFSAAPAHDRHFAPGRGDAVLHSCSG
jgi:hypothetical protein